MYQKASIVRNVTTIIKEYFSPDFVHFIGIDAKTFVAIPKGSAETKTNPIAMFTLCLVFGVNFKRFIE